MRAYYLCSLLLLSSSLGLADGDEPSTFRLTSANAELVSLSSSCAKFPEGNWDAVTISKINFKSPDGKTTLSRFYYFNNGKVGYATCEDAKAKAGTYAYPIDFLQAFSETKNGDITVERFVDRTVDGLIDRTLCYQKYLDLYGSAADPKVITTWRAGKTAVKCP